MTAAEQIVQRLVEGEDIDWSEDPEDPDASTTAAARITATEEYVVLGLLKNDNAPAANRYPGYTTRIEHVDYTSIATAENHIARYLAEHPTSEPAFNWRHMYDEGAIICETWYFPTQKGPHAPWGIKRVQRFVEGRGFVQPVTGNILESEEIDRIESVRPTGEVLGEAHYDKKVLNMSEAGKPTAGSESQPGQSATRIYRAGNAEERGIKPFSSWSEDEAVARAYLDNPGFGGETLRAERVELDNVLDADIRTRAGMQTLAVKLGFDRDSGEAWMDNGWQYPWEESSKVKKALENSEFKWLRYVDDFPQGAKTIIALKEINEHRPASFRGDSSGGRGFVQPVTGNILESEEIDWAPDPEDPDAATRISPKAFSEIEKREVPDEFVDSYVSALLWTRNDEAEDGAALNVDFDIDDIDEKTMAQIRADCQDFWATNYEHIHDRAYQAGTDFCLSRNRHGSGFWDREEIWGATNPDANRRAVTAIIAKHLHEMSVPYGSFKLYAGADGKVYGQ